MRILLCLPFLLIGLTGCLDCVSPEGEITEEEHDLGNFFGVTNECSANIILIHNPSLKLPKVTTVTYENIQKLINFNIGGGGQLEIGVNQCLLNNDKFDIIIEGRMMQTVRIDGSGNVRSEGPYDGNLLDIYIDGSGDAEFSGNISSVGAYIDGSGDITLSGNSTYLTAEIDGSGNINAQNLVTSVTDVSIDGSGDVAVNVSEELNVKIDGSGDVRYKGKPKLKKSIDGSGDVKRL